MLLLGLIIMAIGTIGGGYIIHMSNRQSTKNTVTSDGNLTRTAIKESEIRISELVKRTGQSNENVTSLLIKLFGNDYTKILSEDKTYNNLVRRLEGNTLEMLIEENEELKGKLSEQHLDEDFKEKLSFLMMNLKYDEALKHIENKIAKNPQIETLATLYQFKSVIYRFKGDTQNQGKSISKALALNEDDPEIIFSYGLFLGMKGVYKEAENYFKKYLDYLLEQEDKNMVRIITAYYHLSSSCLNQGKIDETLSFCDAALSYKIDENNPKYGIHRIYLVIGNAYLADYKLSVSKSDRIKKLDYAIDNYMTSLKVYNNNYKGNSSYLGHIYSGLGGAWLYKEDIEKAIEYHKKALGQYILIYGENHMYVADTFNNMANCLLFGNQVKDAIFAYESAEEITISILGEGHPSLAFTYKNLSIAYLSKKELNLVKAEDYANKAYKIFLKNFSSDYFETNRTKLLLEKINKLKEEEE